MLKKFKLHNKHHKTLVGNIMNIVELSLGVMSNWADCLKENTLAAPVLLGMMLKEAALPPLQSLAEGPSTVFWVAEIKQLEKIYYASNNFYNGHM